MIPKGKYWYMQWVTAAWRADPAVNLCSPATRGIWFDFLNVMHDLDRTGQLSGTREQLARAGRCSAVELAQALDELSHTRAADVTERNGTVTVINRRMQREHNTRCGNTLRQRQSRASRDGHSDVVPHSIEFIEDKRLGVEKNSSSNSDSDPAQSPPPAILASDVPDAVAAAIASLLRAEPSMGESFAREVLSDTGEYAPAMVQRGLKELRAYAEKHILQHRGKWLYQALLSGKHQWIADIQTKAVTPPAAAIPDPPPDPRPSADARGIAAARTAWQDMPPGVRGEYASAAAQLRYPLQKSPITPQKGKFIDETVKLTDPPRVVLALIMAEQTRKEASHVHQAL